MKIQTTFLFLLLVFGNAVRAQLPTTYTDRLNVVFDSVCVKYNLVGATAAINVPNVGLWKRVHGISHPGTPVTENMLFAIGSNTKTMIAAVLLKLQEQQLVDLDDSIGEWISPHPHIDGQITIRQMLNHSSGLYNFTNNPDYWTAISADFERTWQMEEMLDFVEQPYFPRGTSWTYSNTNYILAGIIIEKLTAKKMEVVLRDLIFTPAGLTRSYYYPQEIPAESIAHNWSEGLEGNYQSDFFNLPGSSLNALFSSAAAAGCVMQTAEDNVLFWSKLMGGQIINATSLTEMKQLKNIGSGQGYGLGVFRANNALNGRTIYSHGGTHVGYIAENATDVVSGISFSVLTNQDSISNNEVLGYVIGALHKVGMEMGITDVPEIASVRVSVYPNPTSNSITLDYPAEFQPGSVQLYDMTGRMRINSAVTDQSLSLLELAPGCYMLRVFDQQGILIHAQLVQKQ